MIASGSDLKREDLTGARGLPIRNDVPAAELRRLARREPDRAAAARMFAIANALEGMSRAEAARLAGMERQALPDAVVRYHAGHMSRLVRALVSIPTEVSVLPHLPCCRYGIMQRAGRGRAGAGIRRGRTWIA